MTDLAPFAALVAALSSGDRTAARSLVSSDFGIQDGRGVDGWIEREIAEYANRGHAFGLAGDPVLVPCPGRGGLVNFAVITGEGRLMFEDSMRLGPDGLPAGAGRPFEVVTKLLMTRGVPPRRAIAVRSPRAPVTSVLPTGLVIDELTLNPGLNHDADGFHCAEFDLRDDDLLGREAQLRVSDASGAIARMPVYLRGRDNPFFRDDLYAQIIGHTVEVASAGTTLWSLSVVLADGSRLSIEHPREGSHVFPQAVRVAVVTDALDNDWKTTDAGTGA